MSKFKSFVFEEPEFFGLFLNFGNVTSTEAGNYELASYEYGENNGKLKKITYSNGLTVEYSYNALENSASSAGLAFALLFGCKYAQKTSKVFVQSV